MNPKKHKEFREGIAKEVGVHTQVVDDFINFYYAKLRKKLSQLSHSNIYVDGLGTFQLKKNKLEFAIKKNKSMLGNIAKTTYKGYAKSEDIIENIIQMSNALKQIEENILRKKDFKIKKK